MGSLKNSRFESITDKMLGELLKIRRDESLLIICDKGTKRLAEKVFENSYCFGSHSLLFEMPVLSRDAEEPNSFVKRLMLKYNVILLMTSRSLSHTNARKAATKKGARIVSMPGVTLDMMQRCIDIDYGAMRKLNEKIKSLLTKAKKVRITSQSGTDLSFRIYNKKIVSRLSLDKKGDFDNLPSGEAFVSPLEGSAEGVYVIDAGMAGIGKLKRPITIYVKKGLAIGISGDSNAAKLASILKSVKSSSAYNIAEFGIGTNPKAKITGKVLEDEKVLGTCHIALGNNFSFGGKVNVPIHLDGIITKPTIYLDDAILMKSGKFQF
jgi:leucyl aminopeptidase (aminopeptidase T)